jgi:hypothetical protein
MILLLINDIQNHTGVIEGFMTNDQVSEHLKLISKRLSTELPDNLFSKE